MRKPNNWPKKQQQTVTALLSIRRGLKNMIRDVNLTKQKEDWTTHYKKDAGLFFSDFRREHKFNLEHGITQQEL